MRGTPDGLTSPHPIAEQLPAVLREDPVLVALTEGLDSVLAPALSSLDCLPAYLDPRTAPEDFLATLAAWVGVPLDERWPRSRKRAVVTTAVDSHRSRGTPDGLRAHLSLLTDDQATLHDPGGATWSRTPTPDPAPHDTTLVVEVPGTLPPGDLAAVQEAVESAKPAHVPHRVVVVDR